MPRPPRTCTNLRRDLGAALATLSCAALLSTGVSAQALFEAFTGFLPDSRFGDALDNAGDVDGDGVDDLIVGSPAHNGGKGAVTLYSGRTGDLLLSLTGAPGASLGHAVAGIGDLNGDGRSEFAYSAPGETQVIQGVPRHDPIRVYDPAAQSLLVEWWFSENGDAGWSLAGGGDSDGDGLPDLLIGQPRFDLGNLMNSGRLLRMRITPTQTQVTIPMVGDKTDQQLGWDVAWVGDVGGSSTDDYVVSSPFRDEIGLPGASGVGRIHVLDGQSNLLWSNRGPLQTDGRFGWSVSGGKDYTGDGVPDVVVGAPYYGASDHGRVAVYDGGTGTFYAAREGDDDGDLFGWDVAFAETDTSTHVLVGAPGDGETGGFTLLDPGVVHRLSGTTLDTSWTAKGGASHGHFGRALAVLNDMNADGFEEFAVGQPFPNPIASDEPGYAYLYGGGNSPAAWSNYGVGLAGTLGVPSLTLLGAPKLGTTTMLALGNSRGVATVGATFLGFQTAALPFKMGTLHVSPMFITNLPSIPAAGLLLDFVSMNDHVFSGFSVYLQLAESDPGSPSGVSLSQGLHVTFGV